MVVCKESNPMSMAIRAKDRPKIGAAQPAVAAVSCNCVCVCALGILLGDANGIFDG